MRRLRAAPFRNGSISSWSKALVLRLFPWLRRDLGAFAPSRIFVFEPDSPPLSSRLAFLGSVCCCASGLDEIGI
eukprot:scaffold2484_cov261-Pinguiococcus_pyrenoidosus.AAC.3